MKLLHYWWVVTGAAILIRHEKELFTMIFF